MRQRVSASEKSNKKKTASNVGKAREIATSDSVNKADMGQDGIAVAAVGRRQKAERPDVQKQPAVPPMDTVEISEEGRAASAQTQNRQAETKAAAAEAEQYEGEDLSEYADAELKQMYYKGEITRQEYEDETGEKLD